MSQFLANSILEWFLFCISPSFWPPTQVWDLSLSILGAWGLELAA